ncbi:hypothetical protein AVEN_83165-1 [Araneus ventricosus]|uniref:Uncharacterized protein n=1 Tax=Araneus ventricosus TaxID=182803 RepID=A0A4Y2AMY9_ARAVE|nr:hypothetical protein AVEN_83165-1 [Araneus ventricosus]
MEDSWSQTIENPLPYRFEPRRDTTPEFELCKQTFDTAIPKMEPQRFNRIMVATPEGNKNRYPTELDFAPRQNIGLTRSVSSGDPIHLRILHLGKPPQRSIRLMVAK